MSVTARLYVSEITQFAYNQGSKSVKLQAVSRGQENKEWAAATPSGLVQLTVSNPVAAEQFEIGKEYLVTFEKAPE